MKAQFDLRPAEYLERERKRHSFNFVRLLAVVLLLAFFASSGYYVVMAFLETQDLQSQIEIAEGEIADLETSQKALIAEIARLKEQEEQFRKTLEIMQSEPPTLEVLNALEAHMERGVGANSVRFTPSVGENKTVFYTVAVDASAATEEQIIALTDGLSGSGLFSTVTMPSTKKDEKTGRVSFTLTLVARPFGQGVPEGGRQ
ncbi:hypothetical protein [uncultured Fretibacterium sp.]|uniref:hypothetical protein n=1 Tax=uncultured Fretibacterium sp. TaxID=1678694 RepID=UPI002616342B|nr:hypothetical protein [uncultured Fretibacterium sp.]